MNRFKIPQFVREIIGSLETAGFEAYLVGGCVRDKILLRTANDWDIATSAEPAEIMHVFEKTVPTGLKFGTVTVLCGGGKAEVTTFRRDAKYLDFRRPSSVDFCGHIQDDLSRRDFTINAMAFNPRRGFFDPFNGQSDLKAGLIRAVGDPNKRFQEDALRILRAFRFAAQLDFKIEQKTLEAAAKNAGLVKEVSAERIRTELDKILLSGCPSKISGLVNSGTLDFLGLKNSDKPELISKTPNVPAVRWTAFLYLFAPSKNYNEIMNSLKFDNKTKSYTSWLLNELRFEPPTDKIAVKKRLACGANPAMYENYLKLLDAVKGIDTKNALDLLREIVNSKEPYNIKMLDISGNDIVSNVCKGPECGKILKGLLEKVIENPDLNHKDTLLSNAIEIYKRRQF